MSQQANVKRLENGAGGHGPVYIWREKEIDADVFDLVQALKENLERANASQCKMLDIIRENGLTNLLAPLDEYTPNASIAHLDTLPPTTEEGK